MRCSGCSHHNPPENRFCERCGAPLCVPSEDVKTPVVRPSYGSFPKRFAAYVIDASLVYVLGVVVTLPIYVLMGLELSEDGTGMEGLIVGQLVGIGVARLASWLYEAGMNSSSKQATLGKLVLRLQVTDLDGGRVSFLPATKRHFASYLSAVVLLAGYLIQPAMQRKQALHDLLAETLVLQRQPRIAER